MIACYSITVKISAAVSLSSGKIVDAIAATLSIQMAIAYYSITVKISAAVSLKSGNIKDAITSPALNCRT